MTKAETPSPQSPAEPGRIISDSLGKYIETPDGLIGPFDDRMLAQKLAEPGRGDVLARQERMAELEREIAAVPSEAIEGCPCAACFEWRAKHRELTAELSRLRNEGEEAARKVRPPTESELDLVAYHSQHASLSHLPAREAIQNIVGTAIDAALSDCDPRPISAGQYSGCIQSVADAVLSAFPALSQGNAAYREQLVTIFLARIDELEAQAKKIPHGASHKYALALERLKEAKYAITVLPKAAAPPSVPEALEAEAEFWCRLLGEAMNALDECSGDDEEGWDRRQHAEDAAKRIRAKYFNRKPLTITPSRGLVEAAEWPKGSLEDLTVAIDSFENHSIEENFELHGQKTVVALAKIALRTLSAKPTAIAADREGDRDA